ncbi:MAG: hypothetical protein ACOC7Y_02760 [Chloroflexota bacterium]
MIGFDCPHGVVDEAKGLASEIEGRELPMDFDPGDLSWRQLLLRIVQRFTNHQALSENLREWVIAEDAAALSPCQRRLSQADKDSNPGCPDCSEHWLAQQELSQAAEKAAEGLYQVWLARKALAEHRGRSA